MVKNWAITFYNSETKQVKVDCFCAGTDSEARSDFRAVYRHGAYTILSTVAIPE